MHTAAKQPRLGWVLADVAARGYDPMTTPRDHRLRNCPSTHRHTTVSCRRRQHATQLTDQVDSDPPSGRCWIPSPDAAASFGPRGLRASSACHGAISGLVQDRIGGDAAYRPPHASSLASAAAAVRAPADWTRADAGQRFARTPGPTRPTGWRRSPTSRWRRRAPATSSRVRLLPSRQRHGDAIVPSRDSGWGRLRARSGTPGRRRRPTLRKLGDGEQDGRVFDSMQRRARRRSGNDQEVAVASFPYRQCGHPAARPSTTRTVRAGSHLQGGLHAAANQVESSVARGTRGSLLPTGHAEGGASSLAGHLVGAAPLVAIPGHPLTRLPSTT